MAVLSQGRRWLAPGSYHLQAHGVRLGDLVLTVSHALHPLVVETGSNAGDGTGAFNPLAGIKTTSVRITIDGEGATAHVVYDNPALDLAILRAEPSRAERAREGARALPSIEFAREIVTPKVGDCLVMLATRVHNGVRRLEAFPGHVAFEHAHSDQINTVAALQVNTFTTTLHVLHGDSGAPVLLLRDRARPIIIGVASATRWPAEPFGYVNTVRGILPVLDALTNGSLP